MVNNKGWMILSLEFDIECMYEHRRITIILTHAVCREKSMQLKTLKWNWNSFETLESLGFSYALHVSSI